MVDGFQSKARESRLGIPLIYGIDAIHGHNSICNNGVYDNSIRGATIFPHNVGLGATRLVLDCVPGFLGFLTYLVTFWQN
jgi:beta-glucosidase